MQDEITDILKLIGFPGLIQDKKTLIESIGGENGGPRNINYTELVSWISCELSGLCEIEESVTKTSSSGDHSSFMMELSAFLKELGCPHSKLVNGPLSERLISEENQLLLLVYILGELQAARMTSSKSHKQMKLQMSESDHAKDLKKLLIALHFPPPPASFTSKMLWSKLKTKLADVLTKADPSLVGEPLCSEELSDQQWKRLSGIQEEMQAEYRMRRQMLIKRLDVTIQSFQWSDRAKSKQDELTRAFRLGRNKMEDEPDVSLGALLAARADLAVLEKTSSASVRRNTQTRLNKVLIGKVPDRGGRTDELQAPPKEMPSWSKRNASNDRGGGGFRGQSNRGGQYRGTGRGGISSERGGCSGFGSNRIQGSWNQQNDGHNPRGSFRGQARGRGRGVY